MIRGRQSTSASREFDNDLAINVQQHLHPDQHLASHLLEARRNKHQQSQWYVVSTSREQQFQSLTLAATVSPTTSTAGTTSPALHRGHLRSYQPECPDNSFQSNSINMRTGSRATWSTRTRTSTQVEHAFCQQASFSPWHNSKFLSFKHSPPHQHSSWTTTSKRRVHLISTLRTWTELQGTQANNLSCDYTSRHSTNSIINNASTHRRPKPGYRFTNSCQDSVQQRSSLNI